MQSTPSRIYIKKEEEEKTNHLNTCTGNYNSLLEQPLAMKIRQEADKVSDS